jgi:precorrin-6B methylase 2
VTTDPGALRAELSGRIMGFMLSQAVYVAASLGIADRVADAPRPVDELAREAGADADALYRVLRLLAGHRIFVEHDGRCFTNSELSELLRDGGGFGEFALVFGRLIYPAWTDTLHVVRTGEPSFPHVFGASWEQHLAATPDDNTLFNRFMAGGPGAKEPQAQALADGIANEGDTVVDVGGGTGALLVELLRRRPDLHGIVCDLPHVAAEAATFVRDSDVADRCEVVAGDFADGVPAGADRYVLSHILHGMPDADAIALLRRIRAALADGGSVLIFDGIVAPPNEPGMKLMDMLMLVLSGGRERTEEEWRALLAAADLELERTRSAGWTTLVEAVPR